MSADGTNVQEALERVKAHVDGSRFGLTFTGRENVAIIAYDPEDDALVNWTSGELKVADLRTLLAAVSRPAEARGEPVAWCPRLVDGRLQIEHATADKAECEEDVRMLNLVPNASSDPRWQPVSVQPLYTHPAPSGGEVDAEGASQAMTARVSRALAAQVRAAPRPETGGTP